MKTSVPLPHDSAAQVALTVWTAFPITLEVSGERQGDAITELALKGTALPARMRVLLISLIIITAGFKEDRFTMLFTSIAFFTEMDAD